MQSCLPSLVDCVSGNKDSLSTGNGNFVQFDRVAALGDVAYPDRKMLKKILKTEHRPTDAKVLSQRIICHCDNDLRMGKATLTNEELARKLAVPPKNLNNIVSVFLSMGIMEKVSKNLLTWMQGASLVHVLSFFKSLAREFDIGTKLDSILSPDGINYKLITASNNPFANFYASKSNLMSGSCVKLIMLFLSSNREVLPMHLASCAMWKPNENEKVKAKLKRRIFDLCSILECLHILKRESRPLVMKSNLSAKEQKEAADDCVFYLRWIYPCRLSEIPMYDLGDIEWETMRDAGFKKQNLDKVRPEFKLGIDIIKRLFVTDSFPVPTSNFEENTLSPNDGISSNSCQKGTTDDLQFPLPCSIFGYRCEIEEHISICKRTNKRKAATSPDLISYGMAKLMKTEESCRTFGGYKSSFTSSQSVSSYQALTETNHIESSFEIATAQPLLPFSMTSAYSNDSGLNTMEMLNPYIGSFENNNAMLLEQDRQIDPQMKIATLPPISSYMQPVLPSFMQTSPWESQQLVNDPVLRFPVGVESVAQPISNFAELLAKSDLERFNAGWESCHQNDEVIEPESFHVEVPQKPDDLVATQGYCRKVTPIFPSEASYSGQSSKYAHEFHPMSRIEENCLQLPLSRGIVSSSGFQSSSFNQTQAVNYTQQNYFSEKCFRNSDHIDVNEVDFVRNNCVRDLAVSLQKFVNNSENEMRNFSVDNLVNSNENEAVDKEDAEKLTKYNFVTLDRESLKELRIGNNDCQMQNGVSNVQETVEEFETESDCASL